MSRVMVFIDGENLCFRGQELLRQRGRAPKEGKYYQKDCFLWFVYENPGIVMPSPIVPDVVSNSFGGVAEVEIIRSTYYTSICGDDPSIRALEEKIWTLGMQPAVFKKTRKSEKAKGVDIALTKDMLVHAFLNHYEIAVLVAGDGDYVPLVQEVKRQGSRVVLQFPQNGLNSGLKLACDAYTDITVSIERYWLKPGRSEQVDLPNPHPGVEG